MGISFIKKKCYWGGLILPCEGTDVHIYSALWVNQMLMMASWQRGREIRRNPLVNTHLMKKSGITSSETPHYGFEFVFWQSLVGTVEVGQAASVTWGWLHLFWVVYNKLKLGTLITWQLSIMIYVQIRHRNQVTHLNGMHHCRNLLFHFFPQIHTSAYNNCLDIKKSAA